MWKAFVKLVLLGGVVYFASYASVPNAGTLFEWKFEQLPPKFLAKETPWADSVFHSLSRRQRIAQLFMIAAYSDKNEAYRQQMDRVVEATGVGGLIFFQGGPVRQVNLCNRLQLVSRVPMMVAMDAEWGLNMRMKDSVMAFPYQMQLGAIADNQLIAEMGSEIARQCQLLGVQINFAPVVDVNNNPANPVINYRSFGEQPMNVAEKGFAYSKGLESRNVLAVAKHFPGHGDTNSDSHKTLPTIPHNMHRLDSVELVPFKYLIDSGIGGVMTAHLSVPAIDPKPQQATTLSFKTVSMLLKGKLNFMGLAFTDALNMQGVAAYNSHDESIVKAFLAGNDVLLMPTNITAAIAAIEKAVQQHRIDTTDIDKRCYKILKAKEWMGLNHWKPAPTDSLYQKLNTNAAYALRRKLVAASMVLAKNDKSLIPIGKLDSTKIATLSVGASGITVFQQQVNKYRVIDSYQINKFAGPEVFNALVAKLRKYDRVIIGLHQPSLSQSAQYGITKRSLNFIEALAAKTNVVVVSFASPYSMRYFKGSKAKVIMVAHADGGLEQQAAAQVLFGGIPCNGKLPVGSPAFKAGTGAFSTKSRLSYSAEYPADERSKLWFARVDTLILKAIEDKAMPGCQIVMAYKGDVVFSKSYGYHTYSPSHKVVDTDLYDLASITKIAATINSTMLLTDSYQLQIDAPLSNFLQYTHDTDKANITLRDLLLHQSGLPPGLGFIDKTMIHGKRLSPKYYQRYLHDDFRTPVASRLFIRTSYVDSMIQRIVQTPLLSPEYRYSDLGIMLMQQVIQQITHQRLDSFVTEKFFAPMGLDLCYMPWRQRKEYRCPPTETDKYWRNQTIKGYVNDPTSALMGGVSGHAGLFGNANDLAKLLYMWTNKGYYGGKKYISPETLDLFTHCQDCAANRRGYGFDKPLTDGTGGPCSALASESSFGHSGFTGGLVWADPERELIYVFLTNRTFPKADNNLLVQQNIRTRVQSYFYKAMGY